MACDDVEYEDAFWRDIATFHPTIDLTKELKTTTRLDINDPQHLYSTIKVLSLTKQLQAVPCIKMAAWSTYEPTDRHLPTTWTPFSDAIASNMVSIYTLCCFSGTNYAFFVRLCGALETNRTVRALHIDCDCDDNMVHALQQMLRQRHTPLSLRIRNASWWFSNGLSMDQVTKQHSIIDWKCVHDSCLSLDTWPEQWSSIRGLTMQRIEIHNNDEDDATYPRTFAQFIKNNNMAHVVFRHNGMDLPTVMMYVDGKRSRTNEQKTLQSLRLFHTNYAFQLQNVCAFLQIMPNLRILATALRPDDMDKLCHADNTQWCPFLESATLQHMVHDAKQLQRFLTRFPALCELRVEDKNEWIVCSDEIAAVFAQSRITRLVVFICAASQDWLHDVLRHPQCSIRVLICKMNNQSQSSTFDKTWLIEAMRANTSVQALVFINFRGWLLADNSKLFTCSPRVMMASPVYENDKDEKSGMWLQDLLYQRQTRYVLQRDAWQQVCFIAVWYQTLQHHSLRNACFAWLAQLRCVLGGALVSDCEALVDEPDVRIAAVLQDAWYFQTSDDSTQLLSQQPSFQAVMDSHFFAYLL